MAAGTSSADAIVAGACRLIALLGSEDRLTLSAVAAEAGVSRPTLYRWFPTRDDLLRAISQHQEDYFYQGLTLALECERTPSGRLDAALRYLVTYLDETLGTDAILRECGFVVRSLAASLPKQRETWVRLLGDELARLPAVKGGKLSVGQAAELFLRLAYSHYLIPSADPEALLQCMRHMASLKDESLADLEAAW